MSEKKQDPNAPTMNHTLQVGRIWIEQMDQPRNQLTRATLELFSKKNETLAHLPDPTDLFGKIGKVAEKRLEMLTLQEQLEKLQKEVDRDTRKIEEELFVLEQVEQFGSCKVAIWQRDCDCYESEYVVSFKSIDELEQIKDEVYEGAEGPVRFNLLDGNDGEYEPRPARDRVLEAFENGNYYSV